MAETSPGPVGGRSDTESSSHTRHPGGGGGQVGKTTIENAVVAKVAGLAANSVNGVYSLGGGIARAVGALRDITGTQSQSQGISVEVGETQVAVDVTMVAEYPVPLQQLADRVRQAVIQAIETIVGMQAAEVNVTVNDVHLPDDDDDGDQRVQ